MDNNTNYDPNNGGYNYNQGYNEYPSGDSDPVTLGQWMITMLLMCIPIVNIIMLIVWAVSGETAPSKKTWAQAQIIWTIIGAVITGIVYATIGAAILGGMLGGF